MVAVRVRAHDRLDHAAGNRELKRVEMLGQVRTRIDDRNGIRADEIGLRSEESECGRIMREHSGNAGLQLLELCIRRVHDAAVAWATISRQSPGSLGQAATGDAIRS